MEGRQRGTGSGRRAGTSGEESGPSGITGKVQLWGWEEVRLQDWVEVEVKSRGWKEAEVRSWGWKEVELG